MEEEDRKILGIGEKRERRYIHQLTIHIAPSDVSLQSPSLLDERFCQSISLIPEPRIRSTIVPASLRPTGEPAGDGE